MNGILCLEDGFYVTGVFAGSPQETCAETVFHTGTGYDEALANPQYDGKILVFAFPMIGTYNLPEAEAGRGIRLRGLVARDVWLGSKGEGGVPLLEELSREAVPVLTGVDTRGLIRHLTSCGRAKGILAPLDSPVSPGLIETLIQRIR